MARKIDHYEVYFVNSDARVVRTVLFGSDDYRDAVALRDKHSYSEPRAMGCTITASGSEIDGLHERI